MNKGISDSSSNRMIFSAAEDLAIKASNNIINIFNRYGKVISSEIVGNKDYGYVVVVHMKNVDKKSLSVLPTTVDGVQVRISI
jgi:hypothetical protein